MSRSETRIHLPGPLSAGTTINAPDETVRHLRARRLRAGDALTVFDGKGGEYAARVDTLERRDARLTLTEHRLRESEPPRPFLLLQGVAKGDRMDFAVQKGVELGMTRMIPVITARSTVRLGDERAARRRAHWERVAISACEQCGRNRIPRIDTPCTLETAWSMTADHSGVVLDPDGGTSISDLPAPDGGIALLVGPEGGLSNGEVEEAAGQGFARLALGPRILRAETAGIAALTLLQARFGDLARGDRTF
ncbi:Ribosomal RNA small subunit methyltransferase E [wastewater metagenome]|uniref:16S rRNA (uracil(1498)-N(3))-methyltransferase n=2 Tax=unclassified sequences TaxID=12908 RepID=A0A5B8RGB1_9ZZZZ|nr:16S rRNA (uracil(1498)-N(3))-methyltransferase [Arhodomonas aquaeolei]QEA07073.1 ribosomal RNA small subunit methyltransferase E [uncultured organism]